MLGIFPRKCKIISLNSISMNVDRMYRIEKNDVPTYRVGFVWIFVVALSINSFILGNVMTSFNGVVQEKAKVEIS